VTLVVALALASGAAGARDRGADGNFTQRTSAHFVLLQDVDIDESGGFHGSRRFEQQVLDELEDAYDDLDRLLGLRPERAIEVVIYDPNVFDRQFRGLFKFGAAGFYHGVIRIRGGTRLTSELSRVLHHELVHAAFHGASPSLVYPGWVNEGTAEWFEARALGKRSLSLGEWAVLGEAVENGGLLPIEALNVRSFGRMEPETARLAYVQSYALIDHLARHYGERTLPRFYDALIRSRNLDRALERVYRIDSTTLAARLQQELG
jgi:hypothetical protein